MRAAVAAGLVAALSACRTPNDGAQAKEAFPATEARNFFGDANLRSAKLDELPTEGSVPDGFGWSAHYWPSFRFGLGHRYFDQTQSPLDKFEAAFAHQLARDNPGYARGDLAKLELKRVKGVFAHWPGICDGTAEAALDFPEPRGARVVNGVVFNTFELKALLGYFTDMSSKDRTMVFAGRRFDFATINKDKDGRPLDVRGRDTNPGLFHLALGNFIGVQRRGVVADIVPGDIVLNFPVKSYQVTTQDEITDDIPKFSESDAKAVKFVKVSTTLTFGDSHRVLEDLPGAAGAPEFTKDYEYVLELDAGGNVIGGEWTGDSVDDHPDFLWLPKDPNVALRAFRTSRLDKTLLVGPALAALLAAPVARDADQRSRTLQAHANNLDAYLLFLTDDDPKEAPVTTVPVPDGLRMTLKALVPAKFRERLER